MDVIKTLPYASKALALAIICGTLLNTLGLSSFLQLVPNNAIANFHIWSFVTYFMVEKGFLQTVSSLITIVMVGRLVEPLWGSTEFSLYLGCAVLSGGIMVWILCYVLFQSTGEAIFLMDHISGFQAGVGALLVAAKLVGGDQDVGGLQTKWFASIYFLVCTVLLVAVTSYSGFLGMTGAYVGWLYLRFWQVEGENTGEGLTSNAFAFHSFFPEPIQQPAQVVGTIVFNLAAMCKLVKRRASEPPDGLYSSSVEQTSLGTNPVIAARRRQQAQQEIEARLAQVGKEHTDGMDSLLDDVEGGIERQRSI